MYCQVKGLTKTAAVQETADSRLHRLPQKDSYLETKVLAKLLGNHCFKIARVKQLSGGAMTTVSELRIFKIARVKQLSGGSMTTVSAPRIFKSCVQSSDLLCTKDVFTQLSYNSCVKAAVFNRAVFKQLSQNKLFSTRSL